MYLKNFGMKSSEHYGTRCLVSEYLSAFSTVVAQQELQVLLISPCYKSCLGRGE